VKDSCGRAISFTTTSSEDWIEVPQGEQNGWMGVTLNAVNLNSGTYTGTITIDSGSETNNTRGRGRV